MAEGQSWERSWRDARAEGGEMMPGVRMCAMHKEQVYLPATNDDQRLPIQPRTLQQLDASKMFCKQEQGDADCQMLISEFFCLSLIREALFPHQ